MVAPINVNVTEGEDGKVEISEGEYTSEGFETNGLNPSEWHAAGIACYYTGPRPAIHKWPNNIFSGSYIDNTEACNVVNNTNGSTVGYKYFNFGNNKFSLLTLRLIPQGVNGTIHIWMDSPFASLKGAQKGAVKGREIGSITLTADMAKTSTELSAHLSQLSKIKGKHALYLTFSSNTPDASLCTLTELRFQ